MSGIRPTVLLGLMALASCLFLARGYTAITALIEGHQTDFLAFPLTVIMPTLAFIFLVSLKRMVSEEGVLMQLGAMIQILLILAFPAIALHLVLGFPMVFLLVELFETKVPNGLKAAIKTRVIA